MEKAQTAVFKIDSYYRKLLLECYKDEEDAMMTYERTKDEVIAQLLPYALVDNYWWEQESIAMAYFQIHNQILVVKAKTFQKYYHKLMGKKYDYAEFADAKKRAEILKEAQAKYVQKASKKSK